MASSVEWVSRFGTQEARDRSRSDRTQTKPEALASRRSLGEAASEGQVAAGDRIRRLPDCESRPPLARVPAA
jgi:hypothetical protein